MNEEKLNNVDAAWIISGRMFECLATLDSPIGNAKEVVEKEFWRQPANPVKNISDAIGIIDNGDYYVFDAENEKLVLTCPSHSI